MAERISVVVVDDHSLFRAGVVRALELDAAIEIVGQAGSSAEAMEVVVTSRPDIVLLDISMPGNGIDLARSIATLPTAPRIIMLTVSEDDDDIMSALEAGAVGYILKGIDAMHLVGAVKSVAAGGSFVSPNLALRLMSGLKSKLKPSVFDDLSEQEERALRLVAKGMSNRAVAERLGVQEKTVKFHMTRIMAKLNVRNRVEASLMAQRRWGDTD